MSKTLKINSFFSGIGGFDLGFEKAGFEVSYQCEIDSFCNLILAEKWPNVARGVDITKVKVTDIPHADVWCGGFPCQDVSVARGAMGRAGLMGKNSGLFFDFLELIKAKKPKVLLIENVAGLLSSHGGNDFKIVIQSLTNLGYGVSWRVFNTRYFGSPQSRPRVYICAWINNLEKAIFALHEFEASIKPLNPRHGFLSITKVPGSEITVPEVAYCLAATSGRHTGTDWSRTYVSYNDKVRRLVPSEAEKLQGFPMEWTIPHLAKSSKNLDMDSLRYHAIGNAVSVSVVVWIADRIKKVYPKSLVNRGLQPSIRKFFDFSKGSLRTQFFSDLNSSTLFDSEKTDKIKWNSGGVAFGDEIIDCKVECCPTFSYQSYLMDLIETGKIDDKYFLSSGAARGILRRVGGQGRKLFSPLMRALILLAKKDVTAMKEKFESS